MNIRREPALALIAVAGPLATLIVSFFPGLGIDLQTAINAVAVAAAGIATAALVRSDRLAPAILGLAQAVATFAVAYGLHLTASQEAGFLTVAGIVVAAFVRTQVDAPVPPQLATAAAG